MSRASATQPPTDERRRVEHSLDRIEDRLRDAPDGLHDAGEEADPAALAASPLPPGARLLWGRWDGLVLAHGELTLFPLATLAEAQAEAQERLGEGDIVIGERGGDVLVLAGDPHAEGADVVLVEEDGERLPHSSSVDLMVLAAIGEAATLFDEEGEYQADLFGPDGELTLAAERRMLRRHLDLDPDAPLARFRLAQSLRRSGESRAAALELGQLLRRAPEFAWAHHELGRARLGMEEPAAALKAFVTASEHAVDEGLAAYFLAWACLAREACPRGQDPKDRRNKLPERDALAGEVLRRSPNFVANQEAGVREALDGGDGPRAAEMLRLGLAVVPGHLGLLSLREAVANAPTPSPRVDDFDGQEVPESEELDDDFAGSLDDDDDDDDDGDEDELLEDE